MGDLVLHDGGLPALVALLGAGEAISMREEAAALIAELARGHGENQNVIAAEGAIPLLIPLLKAVYDPKAQRWAALAVGRLADGNDTNKTIAISYHGVFELVKQVSAQETIKCRR